MYPLISESASKHETLAGGLRLIPESYKAIVYTLA